MALSSWLQRDHSDAATFRMLFGEVIDSSFSQKLEYALRLSRYRNEYQRPR